MRFVDIIRRKRDGHALSEAEIRFVVDSITGETAPDYQLSALLMAIFLNGMTAAERGCLTREMTASGDVLDLGHLEGGKVDKHSTGGVGDKVSICLAPAVAACGAWVPMVSGRGLGHTGGTLDKLEAIPGLVTRLDTATFLDVLQKCGFVMGGQSGDIAPADKKLYALRDVTGTVESLPLIASSIMSKKLAEGIGGLALDVKVGSGAFMKTMEDARALARALVDTGTAVGVTTTAFLTDMDQPLGRAVGHANETAEAIDVLRGGGPADLVELTTLLGAEMLVHAGVADSAEAGRARFVRALQDGSGLERMRMMIEAQGGDPSCCDDPSVLEQADCVGDVPAGRDGFVASFSTEAIGLALIGMGGGRHTAADTIDPAVGIEILARRGDAVEARQPLARIRARNADDLGRAVEAVGRAIQLADEAPASVPLVHEVVR